MVKAKLTRKQLLKEPDEFITLSARAIAFFHSHRKPVLISVALFFIALISVATYRYMDTRWEDAASAAFQDVVSRYQQALADGKTPAEALSAVDGALAELVQRYGRQTAGRMGRLFRADAQLAAGQAAASVPTYEQILGDFEAGSFFHYRVLQSMAEAYMSLKQYDAAIRVLEQVADGTGAGMADAALYQMGLVFNATGDTTRRDDAYRRLSEKYPDSQYVQHIGDVLQAG